MKPFVIHTALLGLVMLVGLVPQIAEALEPVRISESIKEQGLAGAIEYFEDRDGTLRFEDMLTRNAEVEFTPWEGENPNFGFSKSAFWIRITLLNTESVQLKRFLEISYPLLDYIDVHLCKLSGSEETYRIGKNLPFHTRVVTHRRFLIPIDLDADDEIRLYMRVQSADAIRIPMRLWEPGHYHKEDAGRLLFSGLYFGLILAMALYNLFVFFSLREPAYFFYALFVTGVAGFQAGLENIGFQYFWPDLVWWSERVYLAMVPISAVFFGLFAIEFLDLSHHTLKHKRVVTWFCYLSVINTGLAFFGEFKTAVEFIAVSAIIGLASTSSAAVIRLRQGSNEARYLLIGLVGLFLSVIVFASTIFAFLPANLLTMNALHGGVAFLVVCFSFGLSSKLKTLTDDNLRIQRDSAKSLQDKVKERTQALSLKTEEAESLRLEAEAHSLELEDLDQQKTAFFQNMSHELRTPLTLILNPLENEFRTSPDNKNIEVAVKNSHRLLRLVNQLLDFQKLEAGKEELKLSPVNLSRFAYICADYFASACSGKGVSFTTSLNAEALNEQATEIHVLGEVDALEKVTFNLLSNALKYTPRGGEIELGLRTTSDKARIFIRDTGPGISEEGKKKLFQVFSQVNDTSTREYEGTGLGLALVKSLTEEMQGEVGVETEPGQGSTFWAEFPLCGKRKKVVDILIVEDEEPIRRTLASILLRDEYIQNVETAESGHAARALLEKHSFRLIICDEGIPEESGTEFLAEMAKAYPDMRRVLFTGSDNSRLMEKAVNEAWVHQIILKPFDSIKLIESISRLVRDSSLKDEILDGSFQVKDWLLADGGDRTGTEDTGALQALEEISEGAGELVLVVDDLPDMRDLISNSLKNKNYRVATAPNGKRGLEIALQIRPNLIITDWMMPQMSGPELIEEVKSSCNGVSSVPIILLTAKSDEESKLIGTDIGADAFLGKPFNDQELGSMVRNLLSLKTREREVEELNKRLTESVLKRYLPPDLVDQIVSGERSLEQEPQTMSAAVLFSDLEGFTALTEKLRAKKMARVLNEYLTVMNDVIYDHGGTVDKFIGDAIMVVFGAPAPMTAQGQTERARHCALAMQQAMIGLNQKWAQDRIPELKMRIGIHHGPVVVGTFGSDKRSDYTAIGPTVNLASRIESVCQPGHVFVSGEVCDYLEESMVQEAGEFDLKGVGEVNLYKLN